MTSAVASSLTPDAIARKQPLLAKEQARPQLELTLGCNASGDTVVRHRYMAYPLSVSPTFRLDPSGQLPGSVCPQISGQRAYLYRMNTSPGLLAGDRLGMRLQLEAGAQLCLRDQAATKVHSMPVPSGPDELESFPTGAEASVEYHIALGDRAVLEVLPEPIILFADAALSQQTEIFIHPGAALCWGEILLPGRLARGESYQFRQFLSRLRLYPCPAPPGDAPLPEFSETFKLAGKGNRFAHHPIFANAPVLGTLIVVLPANEKTASQLAQLEAEVSQLSRSGESPDESHNRRIELASTPLPEGQGGHRRGLLVRAVAETTRDLQICFREVVNTTRRLRGQSPLPYGL